MFSLCFIMSCFCTIATYIVWFRIRGPCGFVFEMVGMMSAILLLMQ